MKSNKPFVSIIIPVIKINDYVRESIPEILKLDYQDFEIILLPNESSEEHWPKTRIIATNSSNPSIKRNLGVEKSHGEIVAFLDDDAYPKKNWLNVALKNFENDKIVAVGGPAITPKNDSVLQKASAAVYESYVGGGGARNRYLSIGKAKNIDDWPSVNLLVRRSDFLKSGGFDSKFWPGEDTKLCLELLKLGKIIYDPNAIVFHHRRSSIIKHLRQIGNYGLHRGHFAKKYPQNSLKLFYLIPSLFDIYLIIGLLLFVLKFKISNLKFIEFYFIPLFVYLFLIFIDVIIISIRYKNPLVGIAMIPYIISTHIYYGIRFIQGYFSNDISKSTHAKKTQ
jgi:GT2 family glycosyltransferase